MKLYTEEQVMTIRDWQHQWDMYDRDPINKPKPLSFDKYLASLNPIELPSGIIRIEIQHQYLSSKEFYHEARFVNCTKEQYESIKQEIPNCPLNVLVNITPIELPSDEDLLVPFPTEEDGKFENGNEIKCWMNGWEKGYLEAIQSLRNKIKGDK